MQQLPIIKTVLSFMVCASFAQAMELVVSVPDNLFKAAEKGDLECLKALREDALFEADENGDTALYLAAKNGHEEVVKWLLDKPNIHSEYIWRCCGFTDEMVLREDGRAFSCIPWITCDGAMRANIRDNLEEMADPYFKGFTALDVAAWEGHADVCSLLVPWFIDADTKVSRKALYLSFFNKKVEAFKKLFPLADWEFFTRAGLFFLDESVRLPRLSFFQLLLTSEHQLSATESYDRLMLDEESVKQGYALEHTLLIAASYKRTNCCKRIVSYIKNVNEGFLSFLCVLKYSKDPALQLLYRERKAFIYPFFEKYLSRVPSSLQKYLEQKSDEKTGMLNIAFLEQGLRNKTAYDFLPIEELNPSPRRIPYGYLTAGIVLMALPLIYKLLSKSGNPPSSDTHKEEALPLSKPE